MTDETKATTAATTAEGMETAAPGAPATKSAIAGAVERFKAAVQSGELPATLGEPEIGGTGSGVQVPAKPVEAGAVAEEPPEAAPAATEEEPVKPEGETETPPAEGGEGEPLVVEIPGSREGEAPIELEVADQETVDRIRALARGAIRRDQLNNAMRNVERDREEVREVEDEITTDPIAFVFRRLPQENHVELARHLLTQPGVFEALAQDIETWTSPEERSAALKDLTIERMRRERETDTTLHARRVARANASEVYAAIDRIIPAELDDDEAAMMREDMVRDARDYALANRLQTLRIEDIPKILERRLRQYGVDPTIAARAVAAAHEPPPVRSRPAGGQPASPAPKQPDEAAARSTGKTFVARQAAKKAAAAVPGPGGGVLPAGPTLEPGQSIKQRVASMRKLIGGRG